MFAVVSHGGKQYKVLPEKEYRIDLVEHTDQEQKEIVFSDVLLIADDKGTVVGAPTIKGASVVAEIVGTVSDKKVKIFKFRAKKRYKRSLGHRQDYTVVKITAINRDEK